MDSGLFGLEWRKFCVSFYFEKKRLFKMLKWFIYLILQIPSESHTGSSFLSSRLEDAQGRANEATRSNI